jgi:hypothetical protein
MGTSDWLKLFKFDLLPTLISGENEVLRYFVRRDLLDEPVDPVSCLWQLPEVQKILKKQPVDGSWPRAGEKKHPLAFDQRNTPTRLSFHSPGIRLLPNLENERLIYPSDGVQLHQRM